MLSWKCAASDEGVLETLASYAVGSAGRLRRDDEASSIVLCESGNAPKRSGETDHSHIRLGL